MSKLLIEQYKRELEELQRYGGSRNESSLRKAFETLLGGYCKTRDFRLIAELTYKNTNIRPDGTVKDALRLDWGYWEAKDTKDDLDEEIEKKLAKGYPTDNIIFEDTRTAVLWQGDAEILRVLMEDWEALDGLLQQFINYVRPEVKDFREALEQFKQDVPYIAEELRERIADAAANNKAFREARESFLELCRKSINPEVTGEDVREMMIQHILTEDIFTTVFNESQFHRENNIARSLQGIIETFFTGSVRRNTLASIEHYYAVIRRTATNISNHHEKQKFLKVVYENFYKAYNPKAADRLGIVYTPNEIVRFMVESTDYLLHKHFGKVLSDEGVEILDPATGTGTFITELIEYLPASKLKYKYLNEIHCNEVAILPYYIANLNIEYTYQQKMGEYKEFHNICFVDTLDNTSFAGKQLDLFAMTLENTERIRRQNDKEISVIIGNTPYNANQQNENDNNKNRDYSEIDKLIKATYVKESTAQKTKLYDPYVRFFRWATDRLSKNGILAFITNSSFIDKVAFDGFRKIIDQEFSYIYIIDLGGDVRSNPKISGTKNNVFGIQAGVAISFLIEQEQSKKLPCQIFYARRPEQEEAAEKLDFLAKNQLDNVNFNSINPSKEHNWINLTNNDFDNLIIIADKKTKLTNKKNDEAAIFKIYSLGVSTNRDAWIVDLNIQELEKKMKFFSEFYHKHEINNDKRFSETIKWSETLKKRKFKLEAEKFSPLEKIYPYFYRPFCKKQIYKSKLFIDRLGCFNEAFPTKESKNKIIVFVTGTRLPFSVVAANIMPDLHVYTADGNQCLPLYRYDKEGNRIDNITDWGLEQFQSHYNNKSITKLDIFHYTYAVLHNPQYRKKYELNLKRDFPRLPFYDNFQKWANWGQKLMELHLNYETITPYKLQQTDIPLKEGKLYKPKLKADKDKNQILLDNITTLKEIPPLAWEYKLGNRSALEWILDQHKEKKPRDPTIREKFNTYKFTDYKEKVIDLLTRVCTVSVETMKIIREMESE
ncbi:MAG: type ISP restriction/modification enzyme [Spirulina sp.]